MKILFACDLDQTLLHSRHKYVPGDIPAEYYQGHPQTLISPEAFKRFQSLPPEVVFMPVTTRSELQYRRVFLISSPTPQLAVFAHGARLLRYGKDDTAWSDLAQAMLAPATPEFEQGMRLLKQLGATRILWTDGVYIQCHTENPVWVAQELQRLMQPALTEILWGDKKLFLMARAVNKGTAVRRLKQLSGADLLYAAGDSQFDVPMLAAADVALVPREEIAAQVRAAGGRDVRVFEGDFSAAILREVSLAAKQVRGD